MIYKNKKLILAVTMIVICFVSIILINAQFSVNTASYKKVERENKDQKIILIDPGHGGIDGGAVAKDGTNEKDINLKISLKLKADLEKLNYKVVMTREEDKGLYSNSGTIRNKKVEDLNNRLKMKKEIGCDLFVSIHLNMFTQSQYYGAQVWYSQVPESKIVGELIQEGLKRDLDPNNSRLAKNAGNSYKILRNDGIPSVIVECGFVSNPQEWAKLKDDAYQDKIAASITNSIVMYYRGEKYN